MGAIELKINVFVKADALVKLQRSGEFGCILTMFNASKGGIFLPEACKNRMCSLSLIHHPPKGSVIFKPIKDSTQDYNTSSPEITIPRKTAQEPILQPSTF
jgi:hypothetical protein